jgi:hypothetical protein
VYLGLRFACWFLGESLISNHLNRLRMDSHPSKCVESLCACRTFSAGFPCRAPLNQE